MSTDPTEPQDLYARRYSQEMSLKRGQPPTQVAGYEAERFLGLGAYGEVWVARERNTGRRVAIKFYAHRGGLDWSLLSREVEKLAFLFADRYVVQLLGVGWEAEPPYYVMEYLERGSLADRLQQGPLPIGQALAVFRDVAVGLVHAHGKGVLHCDLKPANILIDLVNKRGLADFGQSRLSSEQVPALGTLFYMAPEQADLDAVPDARWDVYALGALLYCMLTGAPPHRTDEVLQTFEKTPQLIERLARYRQLIEQSPPPASQLKTRSIDRPLAEIIDRCLAPDPEKRFPNVQAVLDALDDRAARRARRPLMVLGAIGPALLLMVVSWFAWQGFSTAVQQTNEALTDSALKRNRFAAQYVARTAANELGRRFQAVEQVAASDRFRKALTNALRDPQFRPLLSRLSDPNLSESESEALRQQFLDHPTRTNLQNEFRDLIPTSTRLRDNRANSYDEEEIASWFFCDPGGVSTVRLPQGTTVGKNFAWRSFFHGGPADLAPTWRPQPGVHLEKTVLSAVFRSQATKRWIVAVSTPVFDPASPDNFLGVVALTVEVGRFVELKGGDDQFAVLVDWRPGDHKGLILQHPLFDSLLAANQSLPQQLGDYRLTAEELPDDDHPTCANHYSDPLAQDPHGSEYDRRWLAQIEPVRVRAQDTGWRVIVQEAYDTAIGKTLARLKTSLVYNGVIALASVAMVMIVLWGFAARLSEKH